MRTAEIVITINLDEQPDDAGGQADEIRNDAVAFLGAYGPIITSRVRVLRDGEVLGVSPEGVVIELPQPEKPPKAKRASKKKG
jgi:hypothetical protein